VDQGFPAQLFDGQNALRRAVVLRWSDNGLEWAEQGGPANSLPFGQLRLIERRADSLVFGRHDQAGWRLLVAPDAPADLLNRMPQGATYGGWIDRFGLARASILLAAASAAVVAAVLTAPGWLGPLVPEAWERQIGLALVGDLEPYSCNTRESDAALAALVQSVDDGGAPVTVQLVKIDMVNAVALPGGRVLIFDKLVQEAKSPDELAGVLAHELGHVRKRHVMQALLRQFGLSILLGGANSDLGGTLGGLTSMGYSRKAEREADEFSRQRLAAAQISPAATGAFFGRLGKSDPAAGSKPLSYLSSHPDTAEREAAFTKAVKPGAAYRPALNAAQFDALRMACAQDRKAREWSLF